MKAFDTVNHRLLFKELAKYGIKGRLLAWIENYLTDRKQCTIANNIISNKDNIPCDVQQGSVLGPLLFLIYIDYISCVIKNSKISIYADDTVVYLSNVNQSVAVTLLQSDLDRVYTWCNSNKLTINCKKNFCIFSIKSSVKRSKTQDMQLSLSNQPESVQGYSCGLLHCLIIYYFIIFTGACSC